MLWFLTLASSAISKIERWVLIGLVSALTLLILLNVVTRSLNLAVYWVDELAIYAMVWLVMVGASVTIRQRQNICVTLLEGWVGKPLWGLFLLMVDSVILAFCLVLIWLSWIWYDPLTLMAVGFDTGAFSGQTFNYIYDEPTLTVGVAKFWIWMIMPITAMTMTIHAAYNLFCRTNTTSKQ